MVINKNSAFGMDCEENMGGIGFPLKGKKIQKGKKIYFAGLGMILISTRRLASRPDGVSLEAIGILSP